MSGLHIQTALCPNTSGKNLKNKYHIIVVNSLFYPLKKRHYKREKTTEVGHLSPLPTLYMQTVQEVWATGSRHSLTV